MGLSSSKKTTKVDQKSTEQGTSTPTNPQWATDVIQGHAARINDLAGRDPYSFVAGPSELQEKAWAQALGLGGWQAQMTDAAAAAKDIDTEANLAALTGYQAPKIGPAAQGQAMSYDPALVGNPILAGYKCYDAPQLGSASLASAQGYNSTQVDPAQFAAIREAQAFTANASRGADFMAPYQNPYLKDVVDTTLADMDEEAGKVRAQQAADAAKNRAFGGSRLALREAATEGELGRARASAAANLRSNAFSTAAGLGMADADRVTNVGMFNAGQLGETSRVNAKAENDRSALQAQLDQQRNIRNADAADAAAAFLSTAKNKASEVNSGYQNLFKTTQAGLDVGAAQTEAEGYNRAQIANSQTQSQFALADQAAKNTAASQNMSAANTFGLSNLEAQRLLQLEQAKFDAQQGMFNAGNGLDLAKFNAGQRDAAAQRQAQVAGLLAQFANSTATNQRADLGLLAEMGNQQWTTNQARAQAPLTQAQLVAQMMGSMPFNLFNGRETTGSNTLKGTTLEKSTPSVISILQDMAQNAAQAYAAGASDRRLKCNIDRVGEHQGLGLYEFNYRWDDERAPKRTGVMADEVEKLRPDALGPLIAGEYKTVYYHKLGLGHLMAGMN
jgi:hypothetical protein